MSEKNQSSFQNKIFKAGMLTIILLIPALVFLFLKAFGVNKFELPIYNPKTSCSVKNTIAGNDTLHRVVLKEVSQSKKPKVIEVWSGQDSVLSKRVYLQMMSDLIRLKDDLEDKSPQIQVYVDSVWYKKYDMYYDRLKEKGISVAVVSDERRTDIVNCQIVSSQGGGTTTSTTSVLLDTNNVIRGYYNSAGKDEIDRMIIEIQVLINIQK